MLLNHLFFQFVSLSFLLLVVLTLLRYQYDSWYVNLDANEQI
jgi:hypothetical protein